MNPPRFLYLATILLLAACQTSPEPPPQPNLVLIFCDDLGYGDLANYGHPVHHTPYLDQMAQEGMKFTNFYVSSGVCTPSRASLMTGSYPRRVDLDVNARPRDTIGQQVLFPLAHKGLNPAEYTLAEVLKDQGYATACIGKWHLGDQPEFLPTRQGFDTYYGIPYSNDMNRSHCSLPLMRGEAVIETPVDQHTLTQRYTEEAVQFIRSNKDKRFFLYLAHAMPHNPVHASEAFRGKSGNGTYGDAVEEIDWSTGQILNTLQTLGLTENTLLIFTSDNGAAQRWGGSNAPLSGWKASTLEGGMRVPCLMQWKGHIPAGTLNHQLTTTMDILPTMATLSGGTLAEGIRIDGHDITALLKDPEVKSPYEAFFYYQKEQLQAVRVGNWKLHLPLDSMYVNIHRPGFKEGQAAALFDLSNDIKEARNVAALNPNVVQELLAYARRMRQDLGDLDIPPTNQRPAGYVKHPVCVVNMPGSMPGSSN